MHFKALAKCFAAALVAGVVTQLSSTAGFIRWGEAQGDDYSKDFLDIAIKSWHQDGLTMFLIWAIGALLIYLTLTRKINERAKAEKVMTWIITPITLIYALFMYPSFSSYL